jgi:hypothetical protein
MTNCVKVLQQSLKKGKSQNQEGTKNLVKDPKIHINPAKKNGKTET